MIRINLLPHREARRKQQQTAFLALLALGGVAGVALVLLVGAYNARALAIQNERNGVLTSAIGDLDKKIAEIATLKQEIEALQARQQAVEDLQGERNQPVYLLDELVKQTPPGVYLKSFRQEGQKVTVDGYAQSQERVSELLRNMAGASPWLEKPELIEVKAATMAAAPNQPRSARKVVEFNLIVSIRRQRDRDGGNAAMAVKAGASASPAAVPAGAAR